MEIPEPNFNFVQYRINVEILTVPAGYVHNYMYFVPFLKMPTLLELLTKMCPFSKSYTCKYVYMGRLLLK